MDQIIELKVELLAIKPKIWRKIQVDSSCSFYDLHHILQIAFGWTNSHLFQFKVEDYLIGMPYPEHENDDIPAKEVILKKVLTEGQQFSYEYDFGDSWNHKITVDDFLPKQIGITYPVCIGGERSAPPEDCGGVSGYENMLEALKNKNHPEHKEFIRWLGGKNAYDQDFFDLKAVNRQLAKLDQYIREFEKEGGF